jgi:hypothetical protein
MFESEGLMTSLLARMREKFRDIPKVTGFIHIHFNVSWSGMLRTGLLM